MGMASPEGADRVESSSQRWRRSAAANPSNQSSAPAAFPPASRAAAAIVVALGTDYNILMIARLREQAKEGMDPRQAAAIAFRHAGPAIGAAGLILAGTFASLTLAGNTILSQIGFAVVLRDRAGRVRHGHVLLPQPDRAHRAPRLVARPRGAARAHRPGIPPGVKG
jgi:hypothetical protein